MAGSLFKVCRSLMIQFPMLSTRGHKCCLC